jgi:hypothetical protein
VRHGICFHRRLSTHHADAAPHSAVAELGVVRRLRTRPVKRETNYLNTDLDLVAGQSLQALADALEARGVFPLHVDLRDDQQWYSTLETEEQFTQPEPNIAALLTAIEALDPQSRIQWAACAIREFNIGYDCGDEPWAFNHGLTVPTLARMAALGIALRITLYPAESAASKTSELTHDA